MGLEQLGDIIGTAPYLAPERLSRGQVTAADDVYAAGLVLYRCLAGRLPWDAGTVTEMLYAHARLEPRRCRPWACPKRSRTPAASAWPANPATAHRPPTWPGS